MMVVWVVHMFFLNIHTLSQCEDSSTFNNIDDDFEKSDIDVSSGLRFMLEIYKMMR